MSKKSKNILVVDDDLFVREIISDIISSMGHTAVQAENGREAARMIGEAGYDLIVTDINMPEMNGLELVEKIRSFDADLPIIILTVDSEIDTAVKAIRQGADDYILKGSEIGDTLSLSIVKVLEIFDLKMENRSLIKDLSRKNLELERLAFLDALTGIANRRYYDMTLTSLWFDAMRHKQPLAMIVTDIDRFKTINDTLGHQYGDICIQKTAKTLNATLDHEDAIIARYGGDEFIVVLPDCTAQEAGSIAERMRTAIELLKVNDPESHKGLPFTMSFGTCSMVPQNGMEQEVLMEQADKALYAAKQQGRNRVVISTDS